MSCLHIRFPPSRTFADTALPTRYTEYGGWSDGRKVPWERWPRRATFIPCMLAISKSVASTAVNLAFAASHPSRRKQARMGYPQLTRIGPFV